MFIVGYCKSKYMESLIKHLLLICIFIIVTVDADEIQGLAQELKLYGGTKATVQWERVFSSQRRLEKYKLNNLSQETRTALKNYLIQHAADSEQPIVPGL